MGVGGGWKRGGEGEGVRVGGGGGVVWRGMYSGAPLYYMHKTCDGIQYIFDIWTGVTKLKRSEVAIHCSSGNKLQ